MSVVLAGVHLPDQTIFSAEHSSGGGATEVAHTLSGRPVVFSTRLQSRPATLTFADELAWLSAVQRAALLGAATNTTPVPLSVRGRSYMAIFNHSASDGAVVLQPVMPFCDRFTGTVNLIILEQ